MGKVLREGVLALGDDVNKHIVIPARFTTYIEPESIARRGFGPDFHPALKGYEFIIAVEHFGCGTASEVKERATGHRMKIRPKENRSKQEISHEK